MSGSSFIWRTNLCRRTSSRGVKCRSSGAIDPWNSATGGSERLETGKLKLPPGDPHIVYPGKEKICNSIRWEMLRKGMEDYDYFRLVEDGIKRLGEKNTASLEAQKLLAE